MTFRVFRGKNTAALVSSLILLDARPRLTMEDSFDARDFIGPFKAEADEIILRLNQGLLQLEETPENTDVLREITRAAHTLKGAANMIGLEEIGGIAHAMEDLLALVRDGRASMTAELSDLLFRGLDAIQALLGQLVDQPETAPPVDTQEIINGLKTFIAQYGPHPSPLKPASSMLQDPANTQHDEPEVVPEEETQPGEPELGEFMDLFRAEAKELLDKLNQGLLDLEENPGNQDVLHEIARAAHTLKGSAKMMGFIEIGEIAHRMEDLLKGIRHGEQPMAGDIADDLYAALDAINNLAEGGDAAKTVDVEAIVRKLETDCARASPGSPQPPESLPGERPSEQAVPGEARPGTAQHPPGGETPQLPPVDSASPAGDEQVSPLAKEGPVSPLAEAFGTAPGIAPGEPRPSQPQEIAETTVGQALSRLEPLEKPEGAKTSEPPLPQTISALPSRPQRAETIRISTGKVDALVNVAGEMVGSQIRSENRFGTLKLLQSEFKELHRHWVQFRERAIANLPSGAGQALEAAAMLPDEIKRLSGEFVTFADRLARHVRETSEDTAHLALMTNELHREVMSLRMMPISMIFEPFRRTIRDFARDAGKRVRAEIVGGDTELDKKMLEMIKDPLVHLVRNCIDHGIESPEERIRAGKPPEGLLCLSARHEGDHIFIEISDDGRGIDADKVKRAAVEKGIISEEEAMALTERDALNLIFRPNFSTRNQVTQTSGRGVGMDVVKTKVENLKGEIRLRTQIGAGTTFCLRLPLTLAVTRVLVVEVNGQSLAIPTSAVFKTTRVPASEIKSIERREAIRVQGKIIPLVHLGDILEQEGRPSPHNGQFSAVIVEYAEEQMAFVVDRVVGEQEIVVKNLGEHIQNVPNVAGAALVGSGDILFVLHVPDLFTSAKTATRRMKIAEVAGAAKAERPKRILVVEDSLTTRELERNILQAHGYEVDVAIDGLDGLNKVSNREYDLIVADIAMPRMDGFQMIRKIKEDEALRNIPIIIVTARYTEEDRRKGFELGAEAYVVKTAFDQSSLLDTIQRLIGEA